MRHAAVTLLIGWAALAFTIAVLPGVSARGEELVGCHGGLGGWQSRAVLIHPADWPVAGDLVGADVVHHQLVAWLERLGQRRQLTPVNRIAQ